MKAAGKRWESKFARFVKAYGVEKLAGRLRIAPSAVYHWVSGKTSPHPSRAIAIQRLAKSRRVNLSLDEIYGHFREVRSERYAASPLKP